jgi:hypothetical protein
MGMGSGIAIGEFAKMTGVSSWTLRRLDISGKLNPGHSTGGHRRYDESQVDEAKQYIRRMKLLMGGKNVVCEMDDLDDFFAYLLGLIFADGSVSAEGQVQLEMKDKQIMEDVAKVLGVEIHPRPDRPMWRMTVPKPVANRLVEYGVCRRKCEGFDIPDMSERSFGCFLRGLFDGDGSVSVRGNRTTIRFHGHPKAMAHIQATLMGHFGIYMAWVPDNRIESGMLEIGSGSVINSLYSIMYRVSGVRLKRKECLINSKEGG